MLRGGCKDISGIAVKRMFSDNQYIFLRFLRGCRVRHILLDSACLHSSPGTALSHRMFLQDRQAVQRAHGPVSAAAPTRENSAVNVENRRLHQRMSGHVNAAMSIQENSAVSVENRHRQQSGRVNVVRSTKENSAVTVEKRGTNYGSDQF